MITDEPNEICYLTEERVAYLLTLDQAPDWNFDLRSLDGAKNFYGNQCAEGQGAMILLELCNVDGEEALRGIFKYKSRNNPLAKLYVGIIWIPFMECCIQINIEAVEQGVTGIREALVQELLMEEGSIKIEESFEPPVKVESAEQLFAMLGEKPLKVIASDDERWDEKFSGHPLSIVRQSLKSVTESLRLTEYLKGMTPFRIS